MWEDALPLLRACQNDMSVDQIIKIDDFPLLNAMSAIEILDSRVDTGMMSVSNPQRPQSFNHLTPITPIELIAIMDQVFIFQVLFQTGQPLTQTLFTCLYFHKIKSLPSFDKYDSPGLLGLLHAYLLSVAKCSGLIWNELASGVVRENEDVTTLDKTDDELLAETEEIDRVLDLLQLAHSYIEHDLNHSNVDPLQAKSISTRILFQWNLLYHLVHMYSSSGPEKTFSRVLSEYDFMSNIKDPQLDSDLEKASTSKNVTLAFDPLIAQHLSTIMPTRTVSPISLAEARVLIKYWLDELQSLTQFLVAPTHNYSSISNFFLLSAHKEPPLSPHSRSLYQNKLSSKSMVINGRYTSTYLSHCFLHEFARIPVSVWEESKHESFVVVFLSRFSGAIIQYFNTLCENRPKRRRQLIKTHEAFENLYKTAIMSSDRNEIISHPRIIKSIRAYQLRCVILHLLYGFELGVYEEREYPVIWWAIQKSCIKLEKVAEDIQNDETSPQGRSNRSLDILDREKTWSKGLRCLAMLSLTFYIVPSSNKSLDMANDELRFNRRFKDILRFWNDSQIKDYDSTYTPSLTWNSYQQENETYMVHTISEAVNLSNGAIEAFRKLYDYLQDRSIKVLLDISSSNNDRLQDYISSTADSTRDFMEDLCTSNLHNDNGVVRL